MANLDVKFYWAVFLRRLPYFLVIAALLLAVALTTAFILPPVYRSTASMLVEPQQIPGDLAQSMVPVNPYEQAQIIEQRLMTRANMLDLADRVGLYADQPEMSANAIVGDMRTRIEFIGFTPDPTVRPDTPGATIIGIAFAAPNAELANKGANELVSLVLQENMRLRTGRAGDTLEFFQSEVDRLAGELEKKSAQIAEFKTANVTALPDSMTARRAQQEREQQRLLDAGARGGGAEQPARHRGLGLPAHRAGPPSPPRSAPRRRSCSGCRASSPSRRPSTSPPARRSAPWRPASRRCSRWSTSSRRRGRSPTPRARRASR